MFSQSQEEVKLEWMYKGANSAVDREEYLLGRSIDKTLEQLNAEEKQKQMGVQQPKNHVEHECIPPSIRNYNEQANEQVDLTAKLQEDPLIAIKKREDENRRQFLNNPIQIKKLQKALKSQKSKKNKKTKNAKRKNSDSESEDDINRKLAEKLQFLNSHVDVPNKNRKIQKKSKDENHLDTILMHKYNQLKSKLSSEDIRNILEGKVQSSSEDTNSEGEENYKKSKRKKHKSESYSSDSSDSDGKEKRAATTKNIKSRSYSDEKKDHKPKNVASYQSRKRSRSGSNDNRDFKLKNEHYRGKRAKYLEKKSLRSQENYGKNKDKYTQKRSFYRSKYQDSGENVGKRKYKDSKKQRRSRSSSREVRRTNKSRRKRSSSESSSSSNNSSSNAKQIRRKTHTSTTSEKSSKINIKSNTPELAQTRKYSSESDSSDNVKKRSQTWGLIRADGTRITHSKTTSTTTIQDKKPEPEAKAPEYRKRTKLSEEEKEKRRIEMMQNAKWRDLEREKNVKHYKETDLKEEVHQKNSYDPEFIQKQLLKSANSSSVESRIKSNINNIQRSRSDMNKHFSKRY